VAADALLALLADCGVGEWGVEGRGSEWAVGKVQAGIIGGIGVEGGE
jgi:hypothetical protein